MNIGCLVVLSHKVLSRCQRGRRRRRRKRRRLMSSLTATPAAPTDPAILLESAALMPPPDCTAIYSWLNNRLPSSVAHSNIPAVTNGPYVLTDTCVSSDSVLVHECHQLALSKVEWRLCNSFGLNYAADRQ